MVQGLRIATEQIPGAVQGCMKNGSIDSYHPLDHTTRYIYIYRHLGEGASPKAVQSCGMILVIMVWASDFQVCWETVKGKKSPTSRKWESMTFVVVRSFTT